MHELGLVYQVVKAVDEVKAEQNLTEVDAITLEVGEMTDVVPKYLEEAWEVSRHSTDYPNAKMIVEVIEAQARCKSCGKTDFVRNIGFECPVCNSTDFEILCGKEFNIKSITAK